MDPQSMTQKIKEFRKLSKDYPCDRCIYFAGDFHPEFCINPYRKVDKTLDRITRIVTLSGGDCPGFVEGQTAWMTISLEAHPTPEADRQRARELKRQFEKQAQLETIQSSCSMP